MKRTKTWFTALAIFASLGAGYVAGYNSSPLPKKEGRVTSIGGVFFKSKDPKALKAWYDQHLGFNSNEYGTNFEWRQGADSSKKGFTLWAPFKETTKYFPKEFMINYRVDNMTILLAELKANGIHPLDSVAADNFGKFVHIADPEGNRIELWEPNDVEYEKMDDGKTVY